MEMKTKLEQNKSEMKQFPKVINGLINDQIQHIAIHKIDGW